MKRITVFQFSLSLNFVLDSINSEQLLIQWFRLQNDRTKSSTDTDTDTVSKTKNYSVG